jgi:ubiquinone/menaquinone biosynthesis C-methylase UbiE
MNRKTSLKRFYQNVDIAAKYDALRFKNKGGQIVNDVEKDVLFEMLENHPREEFLLEVASGTGRFARMLAGNGYRIVAVDSSYEMMKLLSRAMQEQEGEVYCVCGDAFQLPFKKKSFKGVYSIRFVWHFASYKYLINAIMEVCKEYFIFDMMNKASIASITSLIANRLVYKLIFTSTTSSKEMKDFFQENGYCILKFMSRFFFPFIFYRKLPIISHWIYRLDMFLLQVFSKGTVLYYKITGL